MNMLYGTRRETYRQIFLDCWRRYREGLLLEGLEERIVSVILEHPEYQALLENDEKALTVEFFPQAGETNPFAHMSLHVALLELLASGDPPGILQEYRKLQARLDAHAADHVFLECLGEMLWQAQREGRAPHIQELLPCVRRLAGDRHGKNWEDVGDGA